MTITSYQLEGLHLLGYNRRQSEFLFLVATHSGYFTSRQFQSFARTGSVAASQRFLRKLLDQKHADFHAYRSGGRVYHLFARKVFQAIDRENLPTRKKHQLEYIKTRLVALDFVLERPEYQYLETEAQKVRLFEIEWNVTRENLPVKMYRAKKSCEVAPRYFVDRFPIFVDPLVSPPVVTFTYIEAGAVSLAGFVTHLRSYMGLWHCLPRFEFLYIAPTDRLFRSAEAKFHHVVYGRRGQFQALDLLEYFRIRRAWDSNERVVSRDVLFLKESEPCYRAKKFTELYETWRAGRATDADVMRSARASAPVERARFCTLECGSSLTVFRDPRWSGGETSESDFEKDSREVSGETSSEVSGA